MKPHEETETLCKKLKPILGAQADALWHMYLAEEEQNKRKVAQDIEIIAEKYLKEAPLENPQILLEPPGEAESKGPYLLGNIVYNKKKLHSLYLRQQDFLKQIGIFAITGEGKTNLAYLLAMQLARDKVPFMVIDWKRSWRNLLSIKKQHPELKNIRVVTVGRDTLPFLWNVFRAPPGTDRDALIGTISDVLERSHLSGPGVAYYFNKIYSKLFKGLPKNFFPNFYDGIRELKKIKVFGREANWKQTAFRIFQSFTLGKASKTFNARNPIKIEELLNQAVILELDLEMPKPLRMFFSELILRWIHLYRLGQGETDKLRHVLFLEEVHNLFAKSAFYRQSNSGLENLYREIRGFGEGIVSITQHPSLLPVELLGNCHTQIFMGLQHASDVQAARMSLFLSPDEDPYFNILNVGECIVKVKNRIEPCLIKTPLVPVEKELVTDEWLKAHDLGAVFQEYAWNKKSGQDNFLSLRHGIGEVLAGKGGSGDNKDPPKSPSKEKPIPGGAENTPCDFHEVSTENTPIQTEKPFKTRLDESENTPVNIESKSRKYPPKLRPQHLMLIDILNQPFSTITARYKRLKLHSKLGNKIRKDLISEKCVVPKKIITNKGWITLFELTKKGKMVLADLGYEFKNESEGVVHKFWKHRVSEFYKNQGFDVRVEEYFVNGRPDIIVCKGETKVAIEIETGKSDYVKNVRRALAAGFDEVLCLAVNRFVEDRIVGRLKEEGVLDERVRVACVRGY
ncbi:MAG: hypothetical protein MJE63_30350 [Proteobacteria bacterium]|nr:hypothetical protein [Pseudomonadota bacterium]